MIKRESGEARVMKRPDSAPLTSRGRARYERLLDTAERLFAERDYVDVSINEIVRVAGGSLSTVYKWFGSKDDLLFAMIRRRIEKTSFGFSSFQFSGSTLEEDVSALLSGFFASAPRHLIRAVLFHSGFFQKYGDGLSDFFEENVVAPLSTLLEALGSRYSVRFALSNREVSLVIIRYVRGLFIETALEPKDRPDLNASALASLEEILLALIVRENDVETTV